MKILACPAVNGHPGIPGSPGFYQALTDRDGAKATKGDKGRRTGLQGQKGEVPRPSSYLGSSALWKKGDGTETTDY
ncbi:hypothetical protein OS493_038570 [Desmophyllum pertusum]|uniref:Uncharacterized protein n=1 Tax=Desmophyllum pertusum TaxID=174260 RepID=A0A9W9YHF8_9CNID|nr:hypothetical protein OS493_038570 [Desmophyllum pertusum]